MTVAMMTDAGARHRHRWAGRTPEQQPPGGAVGVAGSRWCVFRGAATLPMLGSTVTTIDRTMRHPASISVQTLAAGECRLLHAAAGSRFTVDAGRVRLTEPPCDLGGRVVAIDIRLTEGSSHVVESTGCVRMQALTESRLVVEPVARPLAAWRAGWRRGWLHWLSRRVVYKPA